MKTYKPFKEESLVVSGYGYRESEIKNMSSFHKGLDFTTKDHNSMGKSVPCAADGKVLFSGKKDGFGNVVIVEHKAKINGKEEKVNTLYAHLEKTSVKVGDNIKENQEVGKVGNTGVSTGPHLHFEVIKGDYTKIKDLRKMERYIPNEFNFENVIGKNIVEKKSENDKIEKKVKETEVEKLKDEFEHKNEKEIFGLLAENEVRGDANVAYSISRAKSDYSSYSFGWIQHDIGQCFKSYAKTKDNSSNEKKVIDIVNAAVENLSATPAEKKEILAALKRTCKEDGYKENNTLKKYKSELNEQLKTGKMTIAGKEIEISKMIDLTIKNQVKDCDTYTKYVDKINYKDSNMKMVAKLFTTDVKNQFGTAVNQELKSFMKGESVVLNNTNNKLTAKDSPPGIGDLIKFHQSTQYASQNKNQSIDLKSRFGTIFFSDSIKDIKLSDYDKKTIINNSDKQSLTIPSWAYLYLLSSRNDSVITDAKGKKMIIMYLKLYGGISENSPLLKLLDSGNITTDKLKKYFAGMKNGPKKEKLLEYIKKIESETENTLFEEKTTVEKREHESKKRGVENKNIEPENVIDKQENVNKKDIFQIGKEKIEEILSEFTEDKKNQKLEKISELSEEVSKESENNSILKDLIDKTVASDSNDSGLKEKLVQAISTGDIKPIVVELIFNIIEHLFLVENSGDKIAEEIRNMIKEGGVGEAKNVIGEVIKDKKNFELEGKDKNGLQENKTAMKIALEKTGLKSESKTEKLSNEKKIKETRDHRLTDIIKIVEDKVKPKEKNNKEEKMEIKEREAENKVPALNGLEKLSDLLKAIVKDEPIMKSESAKDENKQFENREGSLVDTIILRLTSLIKEAENIVVIKSEDLKEKENVKNTEDKDGEIEDMDLELDNKTENFESNSEQEDV